MTRRRRAARGLLAWLAVAAAVPGAWATAAPDMRLHAQTKLYGFFGE